MDTSLVLVRTRIYSPLGRAAERHERMNRKGPSMPHPNHELRDPQERKAAAELLRWIRRSPNSAWDWVKYQRAMLVQRRREQLRKMNT
jgi:hypothetical protein